MINKKISFIICGLLCVICFAYSISHAAKEAEKRWSVTFEDASVAEALSRLKELTGVNISTNKPIDKKVLNKSYKDKTIDQILMDLFKNEDYAMAWYYSKDRLNSITISISEHLGDLVDFTPAEFLTEKEVNVIKEETVREDTAPEVIHAGKDMTKPKQPKQYLQKVKKYFGGSFINNTRGSRVEPDNQPQTISTTEATDEKEPESAVEKPASIPEWHHLEAPPMPPGLPM